MSKRIRKDAVWAEKQRKKGMKSVRKVNTGNAERWKGWRTSDKPSDVITYNLNDKKEEEDDDSKDIPKGNT